MFGLTTRTTVPDVTRTKRLGGQGPGFGAGQTEDTRMDSGISTLRGDSAKRTGSPVRADS